MGKDLKGGYKIIPLGLNELTTDNLVIEGIYERIESNYRKPLMLSGIKIDGVEKDNLFVKADVVDGNYVIKGVYGYILSITADDEVSLSEEPTGAVTRQDIVDATGLVTPLVPPTTGTHELVGIDDANAQEKIKIGSGLEVENGELKAIPNVDFEEIDSSKTLSQLGIVPNSNGVKYVKTNGRMYIIDYVTYGTNRVNIIQLNSNGTHKYVTDLNIAFGSILSSLSYDKTDKFLLDLPDDSSTKTYVLKAVNGTISWVEETESV